MRRRAGDAAPLIGEAVGRVIAFDDAELDAEGDGIRGKDPAMYALQDRSVARHAMTTF